MRNRCVEGVLTVARDDAIVVDDVFVPIISAFYGIVIRMFYHEHEPAHFHAEHSGQRAKFDFDGKLVAGELKSSRARRRIRRWAQEHRAQLEANWGKMKAGLTLEAIEPLVENKP